MKLKHPYCTSDLIFETLIGSALLKDGISHKFKYSDKKAAFSLEGWTPMSRIFLAAASDAHIKTNVFYTYQSPPWFSR